MQTSVDHRNEMLKTNCIMQSVCIERMTNFQKHEMSHVMRNPKFCKCENKDADQLRGNPEADQRLCFPYIDRTIPLLSISEISSL